MMLKWPTFEGDHCCLEEGTRSDHVGDSTWWMREYGWVELVVGRWEAPQILGKFCQVFVFEGLENNVDMAMLKVRL